MSFTQGDVTAAYGKWLYTAVDPRVGAGLNFPIGTVVTYTIDSTHSIILQKQSVSPTDWTEPGGGSLPLPVSVPDGGTGLGILPAHSLLVGDGVSPVNFIAPGAVGNVLTSNGTDFVSAPPAAGATPWGAPSTTHLLTANGNVPLSATLVNVNATTGNVTATLPLPGSAVQAYVIKKIDASANTVTIKSNSGSIDGAANYVILGGALNQYKSITVISDLTNYWIV